ncbi:filamentous haemagglutinin-like (plasmid) [Calothrix sp. PCC 7716]|nr:filamentous haemagglutinin-like [Calothrix sp. PCC 7716]
MLIYIKELETKVKTNSWVSNIRNLNVSFLLGSVSALTQILLFSFITSQRPAFAQSNIVPDNTLGSEASRVIPNFGATPNELITGGAQRGQNLFHSFQDFNVSTGRGAYFIIPNASIANVLTRVTGSNRSEILGTLGTLQLFNGSLIPSGANLFIINPNGIIFGENSRLDVGGSFLATTANEVQFGDSGSFTASGGQPSQVLTINPSAFLFNQINAAPIVNQSRSANNTNPSAISGLQVANNRSLLFLGGNIDISGGILNAPEGKIELGGLAIPGIVQLNIDGNNLDLIFSIDTAKANIVLSNRASLNTSGLSAGRVEIQGNNVSLSENSRISSVTIGNQNGKGINIQASQLNLSDFSNINTTTVGLGNSGDILIDTENLSLLNVSSINTLSFAAAGNAGNISLKASNFINLDNVSSLGTLSLGRGSAVAGSGGNIRIETKTLNVQNESSIAATTFLGQGNAGSVNLKATETVNLNNSSIVTLSFGAGAGGNITIETENLNLREGTNIATSTVNPRTVNLNLFSTTINLLSNGQPALQEALTVFIENLLNTIEPGNTSSFEQAKPGNVDISTSKSIVLSGVSPNKKSNIISTVTLGSASGGNITLRTGEFIATDESIITSSTTDKGQGGNIALTASDSIKLIGRSRLSTSTSGTGAAGNLKIFDTKNLTIQDGAQIAASTIGKGAGGNIDITADTVEIKGLSAEGFRSGIQSTTLNETSNANAGEVKLTTRLLNINGGGRISTRSINQGQAGKITILVDESLNALDGGISTSSNQSSGGDINIDARDIRLFGDTDISTFVSTGAGGGGDIKLTAKSIIAFGDSDIFAFAQDGQGGNITFATPAFFGQNYRPATPGTNPASLNRNNRVDINASAAVSGVIILPDTSFVTNNLDELPEDAINTNALIANSCIARRNQQNGSFFVTGSGGLPARPNDAPLPSYSTGDVQPVPIQELTKLPTQKRRWQIGDAINEPSGVYKLPNGKLVLGKQC